MLFILRAKRLLIEAAEREAGVMVIGEVNCMYIRRSSALGKAKMDWSSCCSRSRHEAKETTG